MKRTGVACAFAIRSTSLATTAFELVSSGNRVKLFSVVWQPYTQASTGDLGSSVKLTNGQAGGVLYESGIYASAGGSTVNWDPLLAPISYLPIPENGILFDDGIWCQGVNTSGSGNGGLLAISITYQGAASNIT